jgi:hypothetical protein
MTDGHPMRRGVLVLVMVCSLAVAACSVSVTTSPTFGVDGAPGAIKATFLVVSNQASRLAGSEVSDEEWIEFARAVCAADIEGSEGLEDFVSDWAGSNADASVVQMWSTAGNAALTSFCSSGG